MANIKLIKFKQAQNQLDWLIAEILLDKKNGKNLNEIAIITRKHKNLETVAFELNKHNIQINYRREINLLQVEKINQIIDLLSLIDNFHNTEKTNIHLLPDILNYSIIGLKATQIYEFAVWLRLNKKTWFEGLSQYSKDFFPQIYQTLSALSQLSKEVSAEHILDYLLGLKPIPDLDPEQTYKFKIINLNLTVNTDFVNSEDLELINHIKNLKNIINQERAVLKLRDFLKIIKTYKDSNFNIYSKSISANGGLNLITAHGSKGLEFEKVILIDCDKDNWTKKNIDKIKLPIFLPINNSFETEDDIMRLFYVATTRAKKELVISSYEFSEAGKSIKPLIFLAEKKWENIELEDPQTSKNIILQDLKPISKTLSVPINIKKHLQEAMENYELSFTHLWSFIDVSKAGPEDFFKNKILYFPGEDSVHIKFGSSIHKTFDIIQKNWQKKNIKPTLENFIETFEVEFSKEKLTESDKVNFLKKGRSVLTNYFKKTTNWDKNWQTEVMYKKVFFENTMLKGSLDRITKLENDDWLVTDLKTGKALKKFNSESNNDKALKSFRYEMQLEFYKILFEKATGKKLIRGCIVFLDDDLNSDTMELTKDLGQNFEFLPKLIEKVYKNIQNFTFPNTENYSKDLNGVKNFIFDLTK